MTTADEKCNISGVPTARTLILDLLDAGDPPAFAARDFVRAGDAFGIEANSVRTALTRLKAEGRVAAQGRGRYSIGGQAAWLQRRILGWRTVLDQRRPWQGEWLLAVAGPMERADRTQWRRTLRALDLEGFAEAETNVWVRPDNLAGGVAALRERLGQWQAAASLLVVRATDLDARRAARYRQLWDVEALAGDHWALAQQLVDSAATLATRAPDAAAAVETLTLGRQAVRQITRDPLLPDALCPADSLARLIAAMIDYDALGKQVWRAYLASG